MVQTIRREDYRAPAHLIDEVRLEFDLDAESTAVVNTMHVRPNPAANGQDASLFLDGEDLTLVRVALDGKPLDESRYTLSQEGLLHRQPLQSRGQHSALGHLCLGADAHQPM